MSNSQSCRRNLLAGTATLALSMAVLATPAMAIVPNETTNSEEIVDDEEAFEGVGIVVTNQVGSGGIGICTGTLINPRTVLFAAHCVNDRPDTDYNGVNFRGAVAFNFDAFPGLVNWFGTSRTNTALQVYNINRIFYDPRSTQDALGLGFIEADIALASLDTPAAGIPTWALLFSTLPDPGAIDPAQAITSTLSATAAPATRRKARSKASTSAAVRRKTCSAGSSRSMIKTMCCLARVPTPSRRTCTSSISIRRTARPSLISTFTVMMLCRTKVRPLAATLAAR
jgi:Trypsin